MKIATAANAPQTLRGTANKGLRVAFSAGSVMGFVVVGLASLSGDMVLPASLSVQSTGNRASMLTFGMGASCMALFARVGGGIFTKAADVGADLVGKVEAGIERRPRNPLSPTTLATTLATLRHGRGPV
ncbi:MAG: sodium/proton-translocating pyrophosphatase [Oscillospiraceae bacterium]